MSILEEILAEELGRCERHKANVLEELEAPNLSPELKEHFQETLRQIAKDLRRLKRALEPELPNAVELLPCPICKAKPSLCEDIQDFLVHCSEDCSAPKCAHFDPRHTVYSWNDWVRWHLVHLESRKEVNSLYNIARTITCNDAMHLINEAESDEEIRFWSFVHNMNLQRAQKIAIEKNLF